MSDFDLILAHDPEVGRIQLCGCNCIHLSIGPITINLAPEAFAQTAGLIRDAMNQLSKILGTTERSSKTDDSSGQIQ